MSWKDLSIRDKAAYIASSVASGNFNLNKIREDFNSNLEHFKNSDANFVQRLNDNDTRSIIGADGRPQTHRLGWEYEDNHAIIYPEVQDNNGVLEPGDLQSATERRDTVHTSVPFARYYTKNYKKDYPEFFNRFEDGGEKPKLKRVDIQEWFDTEGNRGRAVNIPAMEQLQDSLIARQWGLPQRLAIMATAAQEMDKNGAASRGVGGNGYLGLSFDRMPEEYLDDTPEGRGKQINYIFEDLLTTHPDNWLNGGSGGPTIMSGKDGYNQFWNSNNVWNATQILNKSYIRPRDRKDAWDNRASVAKAMQRHMKERGGILDYIKPF